MESFMPKTLKVSEAARLLGISRATAYNLARSGQLPGARRLGGRIVVLREILEKFLAGDVQAK